MAPVPMRPSFTGARVEIISERRFWVTSATFGLGGRMSLRAGVLTWPMQHPELHTSASVDGEPTIINEVITAAGWVSYVKPLVYFGLFGALGGFAFWVARIWIGTFEKSRRGRRALLSLQT
jgi:hypothetical protein